jgi:hypothetical protein
LQHRVQHGLLSVAVVGRILLHSMIKFFVLDGLLR